MSTQSAQVVPFQTQEWNFNMDEVIKHVDPKNSGSPSEHKYFFELCKAQKLNPLTKEVYFIKYGNSPATVVINVDTFVSRANDYPDYDGYIAGWIVGSEKDPKQSEVPFGNLIGAWCRVGRKGKKHDAPATVRFDAYNTGKSRWAIDPYGMIQKCAIAAAHRKAYPTAFKGLYEWSEMDQAKDGVEDVKEKNKRQNAKNITPKKDKQGLSESDLEVLEKHHPDAVALDDDEIVEFDENGDVEISSADEEEVITDDLTPEEIIAQIRSDLQMIIRDNGGNVVYDAECLKRFRTYCEEQGFKMNRKHWMDRLGDSYSDLTVAVNEIYYAFPESVLPPKDASNS